MPKVGQLLSAVWNLDAICRFKILPAGILPPNVATDKRESNGNGSSSGSNKSSQKEVSDRIDMPPPPSPASSTCSDTGSITTSHSMYNYFLAIGKVKLEFHYNTKCFYIFFKLQNVKKGWLQKAMVNLNVKMKKIGI